MKISVPQTLCVSTRSSLSLKVSPSGRGFGDHRLLDRRHAGVTRLDRRAAPFHARRFQPLPRRVHRLLDRLADNVPGSRPAPFRCSISAAPPPSPAGGVRGNVAASSSAMHARLAARTPPAIDKIAAAAFRNRGILLQAVTMICCRNSGTPLPLLATTGTTGTPSAFASFCASI